MRYVTYDGFTLTEETSERLYELFRKSDPNLSEDDIQHIIYQNELVLCRDYSDESELKCLLGLSSRKFYFYGRPCVYLGRAGRPLWPLSPDKNGCIAEKTIEDEQHVANLRLMA